jgi:hypothetical protein
MSSKPLDRKCSGWSQGATILGPADFPIGSMQSRAAARLRLQNIGEAGKGTSECICFPEDEQPFFRTSADSDLAEAVQCPLHGKRFTPRFHLFVAGWLWENEVKFRWPELSAQYHKAWAASFPPMSRPRNQCGNRL